MKNFIDGIKNATTVPLKFKIGMILLPCLMAYFLGPLGLLYYPILLVSVLFHEYAHVWMALKEGIGVHRVVIHMFGAMAVIDPENVALNYKKEWRIAIAGPLGSLGIAGMFLLPYIIFGEGPLAVFEAAVFLNLGFAVFNMLPLYPSDGGRVLNAILSKYVGYRKALNISSLVAYILAGTLGVVGLIYGLYWLVAVLIFLTVLTYHNKKVNLKNIKMLESSGVRPVR